MAKTNKGTSVELYSKVQTVIDELDKAFFSGKGKEKIPQVVFAINTKCKACVVAYVQADALYDKKTDKKLQYMAINPDYLNRKQKDILSTVCHELCHVYEHAYIHIPRGGYHDKQWAKLMEDCGLEPKYLNTSKTAVDHKIIKGGAFEDFAKAFEEKYGEDFFNIVSYSSEVQKKTRKALGIKGDDEDDDTPRADNADKPVKKYNRNKIKYVCRGCGLKVWGKPGLSVSCNECMETLDEEE
jgi:predicted SprT family Zn-dependent metalloprotease